ncbi:hypothetical protein C5167_018954 [Papaver somniferum]|uniref:Uncharacterized protein n=1 Tax=Papaver somniferum TaxID=3469 RepID=A0A4Y7ISR4_PAPSO|nr:hypothetical protein C5167_018954 [Papaver somniferum]
MANQIRCNLTGKDISSYSMLDSKLGSPTDQAIAKTNIKINDDQAKLMCVENKIAAIHILGAQHETQELKNRLISAEIEVCAFGAQHETHELKNRLISSEKLRFRPLRPRLSIKTHDRKRAERLQDVTPFVAP